MWASIAVPIVTSENMTTVWATSPHLMLPLGRFTELSNALMHWKKISTTIPGITVEEATE